MFKKSARTTTTTTTTTVDNTYKVEALNFTWTRNPIHRMEFDPPVEALPARRNVCKLEFGPASLPGGDNVIDHHPCVDRFNGIQEATFEQLFACVGNGPKNSKRFLLPKGTSIDVFPLLQLGSVLRKYKKTTKSSLVAAIQDLHRTSEKLYTIVWTLAADAYARFNLTDNEIKNEKTVKDRIKDWNDMAEKSWMVADNQRPTSLEAVFIPALILAITQLYDSLLSIVRGKHLHVVPLGAYDTAVITVSFQH